MRLKNGDVVQGKMLLGADGAKSEVAKYLQLRTPSYAGYSAYRQTYRQEVLSFFVFVFIENKIMVKL